MTYPIWIKNSKGKYRLNPIGDKIKLLRKLPNGNWGCTRAERLADKELDEFLCSTPRGFFRFIPILEQKPWDGNYVYELRLD